MSSVAIPLVRCLVAGAPEQKWEESKASKAVLPHISKHLLSKYYVLSAVLRAQVSSPGTALPSEACGPARDTEIQQRHQ